MNRELKICVIGLGYIGLPTASLLASNGFDVLGVDVSENVVNGINQGCVHIFEPGLDVLVKSAVNSGKLKAALCIKEADVYIIAVPTPFDKEKNPDLSYVKQAAVSIAAVAKEGDLVILESTSPIGTTEMVYQTLIESGVSEKIHVAHCPERVIPGKVLKELVENDRVVGGVNKASTQSAVSFYKCFVDGEVLETSARVAELCKLSENAYRDVNIAFANELSVVADEYDINVWELIRLANHHPRVNILQPGPGVGGHCIAVDPWFIVSSTNNAHLIKTARQVNDGKPNWVVEKIKKLASSYENPTIGCFGVTFKADVDDMRESPAFDIVKKINQENIGQVIVNDPLIQNVPGFESLSLDLAIEQSDICVILVDHKEYKQLDPAAFLNKDVIDTKGIIFEYIKQENSNEKSIISAGNQAGSYQAGASHTAITEAD